MDDVTEFVIVTSLNGRIVLHTLREIGVVIKVNEAFLQQRKKYLWETTKFH